MCFGEVSVRGGFWLSNGRVTTPAMPYGRQTAEKGRGKKIFQNDIPVQ